MQAELFLSPSIPILVYKIRASSLPPSRGLVGGWVVVIPLEAVTSVSVTWVARGTLEHFRH